MREIKFRGKRKDNGEWIVGYYGYKELPDEHFIIAPTFDSQGSLNRPQYFTDYLVDPETVGQYTGLKDQNGKEIYEGDIQEGGRFDKEIKIVRYDTRQSRFKAVPLSLFKANAGNGGWTGYDVRDYAVIGNIYENPELLEVPHEPARAIMPPGTKRTELLDKLIETMSQRGKEARGEEYE